MISRLKIQNEKGFSLLSVMVAAGVMMVIIAGMASWISTVSKNSALLEARLGEMSLMQDIQTTASKSLLCTAAITPAIKGAVFQPAGNGLAAFEMNIGGNRIVKPGADLRATYGVSVETFGFENVSLVPGSADTYVGDLFMQAAPKSGGFTFAKKTVTKLFVRVGADKKIVSCYAANDVAEVAKDVCQQGGGQYVDGKCKMPDTSSANGCDSFNPSIPGTEDSAPQNYGKMTSSDWAQVRSNFCNSQAFPMSGPKDITGAGGGFRRFYMVPMGGGYGMTGSCPYANSGMIGQVNTQQTVYYCPANDQVAAMVRLMGQKQTYGQWNFESAEPIVPFGPFQSKEECMGSSFVPENKRIPAGTCVNKHLVNAMPTGGDL